MTMHEYAIKSRLLGVEILDYNDRYMVYKEEDGSISAIRASTQKSNGKFVIDKRWKKTDIWRYSVTHYFLLITLSVGKNGYDSPELYTINSNKNILAGKKTVAFKQLLDDNICIENVGLHTNHPLITAETRSHMLLAINDFGETFDLSEYNLHKGGSLALGYERNSDLYLLGRGMFDYSARPVRLTLERPLVYFSKDFKRIKYISKPEAENT